MAELRSFIFIDRLQSQTMSYLGTWIKGALPRANQAAQIIEVAPGLDIEGVTDVALKHAEVKAWLAKHPRFHMHFTPTSSSWLNLVERFFRDVTQRIRDCSFASVRELADTIIAFLADRNQNPKRYVWKAKGEDILRKIHKARQAQAQQTVITSM